MNSEGALGNSRALIVAPRGRDAMIAAGLVEKAGVAATICSDIADLVAHLGDHVAFALITEEAIAYADLKPLTQWLAGQAAWSDLPFILVTDHGGGPERNPLAMRWLETLANVAFVERPFHPTTLVSLARTTAQGRHRQHQMRQLLAELSDGEARLRTALRAGRLGPWEYDFGARRLILSDGFRTVFGTEQDLDPASIIESVHSDDRVRVSAALQHSIATGADYRVEFRRTFADGRTRWIDARATLVRDPDGVPKRLVGLSSDITERKEAEAVLQEANERLEAGVRERTRQLQEAHDRLVAQTAERERTEEQLRHMQKLESIGELTGGVAHDFNNLLTAIIGNIELLRKRVPSNPTVDRLIDGALQGANRGAALTQRLLAFARRQALEPRPVDLAGLIRGMAELLRRSVGPTVELDLDLPPGLPAVQVDANQIELALLNLAINARDAMPDGGTIHVGLRRRSTPETDELAAGEYVCLGVGDSGVGMDTDTLQRAIEPFFSTKGIGKGTGLGLSMVHGVARQLKGALKLESTLGKGTVAELWLPVSLDQPQVEGPENAPNDDVTGRKLLLVDDDPLISLSTKALLEDLGHEVIDVSSGPEALRVLESDDRIDLMITDYAMPGMTGLQLVNAARGLRAHLPILLATGYAELPPDIVLDLPRLMKPFRQSQLAEQIAALTAG